MLPPSPPPTPAFTRAGESASADLDEDEIPWAYKLDALWTLFWKDPDLLEADCAIVVHSATEEGQDTIGRTYHVHLDKVCRSRVLLNAFLGRPSPHTAPNTNIATGFPTPTISVSSCPSPSPSQQPQPNPSTHTPPPRPTTSSTTASSPIAAVPGIFTATRDLSQPKPTIHLRQLPDPASFPLVLHKLYFGHDALFAHDQPGSKAAVEANRKALGLLDPLRRPIHRHSVSQPPPSHRERSPYFAPALQLYRSHSSSSLSLVVPLPPAAPTSSSSSSSSSPSTSDSIIASSVSVVDPCPAAAPPPPSASPPPL